MQTLNLVWSIQNIIFLCLTLDFLITQNLRMRKEEEPSADYYNDCEFLVQKIVSSNYSITWNQLNFPVIFMEQFFFTFLLLVFLKNE